jgi:hypothetical protein
VIKFWFNLPFRVRLGVASILFLIIAAVLAFITFGDPVNYPINKYGTIIRIAPLLFLVWLSWRDLSRIPLWGYIVFLPLFFVCLIKPVLFFYMVPLFFIVQLSISNYRKK